MSLSINKPQFANSFSPVFGNSPNTLEDKADTMNGNYGMYIGINGFGRIGKALFLQLLGEKICRVRAVNIPGFDVENMEQYLKFDSVHKKYTTNWKIGVIDDKSFYVDR